MQDLLGQALAHLVLVLAAVLEQGGEALRARLAQEPVLAEEHPHCSRDRPPCSGEHVRNAKVEPARALAPWRRNEAKRCSVEEQSRRHAGMAQEAFHAAVGRGFEAAARPCPATGHVIEVLFRIADANEQLPGRCAVRRGAFSFITRVHRRSAHSSGAVVRCVFAHARPGPCRRRALHRLRTYREVGAQDLASFCEHGFEIGRNGRFVRTRVAGGREVPSEHRRGEGAKVRQPGLGVRSAVGRITLAILHTSAKQVLTLGVASVQYRPCLDERRCGDNESGRTDEADPLQVGRDLRVEPGHRLRWREQGDDAPPCLPRVRRGLPDNRNGDTHRYRIADTA